MTTMRTGEDNMKYLDEDKVAVVKEAIRKDFGEGID